LVSVNPPSLNAAMSNNAVNLSFFPTVSGHDYNIQYKTNLTDATRQTLSTVPGTGSPLLVPDSTNARSRFYRIYVQ
jgi:hypothetical protein